MHLGNPWGLLALLAIPAILAVHLFRQRFREMPVAGTHLWASLTEVRQAGRRLDRLPFSKSLLFEILAVLAVTAALCRPEFRPAEKALHLVVVLDDSASMNATPRQWEPFKQAALHAIEERCTVEGAKVVLTILLTGERPVMLAGPSVSFAEASPALGGWVPTAPRHDPAVAIELANQLAADSGQVLFITDTQPEIQDAVDYVSIGKSVDNVGFTASRFNPQTTGQSASVFLRVRNFAASRQEVVVDLETVDSIGESASESSDADMQPDSTASSERSTQQLKFTIEPASVVSRQVDVPAATEIVRANLSAARNSLAVDDTVELLAPPNRTILWACDFAEPDFRMSAIERALSTIDFVQPVPASERNKAHVVFAAQQGQSKVQQGQWLITFGESQKPGSTEFIDVSGPYVMDRRSPLLTGVTLDGVIIAGIAKQASASPLISVGQRVLFGQQLQAGVLQCHFNMDLNRSTLVDSPDWPILISNIVEQRRQLLPGPRRSNYRVGENVSFLNDQPATPDRSKWTVTRWPATQDNVATEITAGRNIEIGPHLLKHPGIYNVADDGNVLHRFAVNFHNATESNLLPLTPGEGVNRLDAAGLDDVDSPFTWITILAIGCTLLAVVANWRSLANQSAFVATGSSPNR